MNIEDGYDLPLRVTFQEEGETPYWRHHLGALPHVGDTIILGSAPKGIRHVVRRIDHHVGGASHRIVIHRCAGDLTTNRLFPAKGPNRIEITIFPMRRLPDGSATIAERPFGPDCWDVRPRRQWRCPR